jgi:hypothetical protein
MIFLQTTGIVTLTLVINGTTAGMVYKKLVRAFTACFDRDRPIRCGQGTTDDKGPLQIGPV